MVATLPGRTQGLGLITEPLLRDLKLSRVDFGLMNLWATLIGSMFGLACGPLIDRFGARIILTSVFALLGASVLAMSRATSPGVLLAWLTLTRGFGQSALSVVSITIVGKWFVRRLPTAMGVYSFLISAGFIIAFPVIGAAVRHGSWRAVWAGIGWTLLAGLVPISWLVVRRTPESVGLTPDGAVGAATEADGEGAADAGLSLGAALRTPAFWSFALAASAFGLVSSGLMLFNEAVLAEHGAGPETVLAVLAVITFVAMLANFVGGWLAQRWPVGRLMGAGMGLLAMALFFLPLARGQAVTYLYAVLMGASSGVVTVVFFVCWARVFGRSHLGAIQGAAQLLTVLASAAGPWLLARSLAATGSSTPLLFGLAPVVAVLGVCCVIAPLPMRRTATI